MSKFLWITSRNNLPPETRTKLQSICEELIPENIVPNKPLIHISDKVAYGIANPKNNVFTHEDSFFVGAFIGDYPNWHQPKSEYPDGSFALFREDDQTSEVVADPAASRTIWYYFDSDLLIASTSQLAIVRYLGNFEFNMEAIPWMLSSGTIGPSLSWDKRLIRIMPDSSILLNKKSWKLEKRDTEIIFEEGKKNKDFYERKLKETLNDVFQNFRMDLDNWILPLSGGYDSRALLFFLKNKSSEKVKAITWGLAESKLDPNNDAYIAKKLAEETEIEHDYLETDLSKEPLEGLINRFIKNGEGRIDSISGYLDGFKLWETLHNRNVQGILRGDVGWTSDRKIYSHFFARKMVGLLYTQDFLNLTSFSKFDYKKQSITKRMDFKSKENPEVWRDRLYHNYRIPTILASLSDLKLGYIEQCSPLLSRKILTLIREEPNYLRRDKKLFKTLVNSMYPDIPIASNSALESMKDFLKKPHVTDYLKCYISESCDNFLFSEKFMRDVFDNLDEKFITKPKNSSKSILKSFLLPSSIKFYLKKFLYKNVQSQKEKMSYNLIAFRIILILKTYELFNKSR
jgi:hypothetical protein